MKYLRQIGHLFLFLCLNFTEGLFSRRRRKPLENQNKNNVFIGNYDGSGRGESTRPTIQNMTCSFYEQPLNHFDLPRGRSGTYQQRFCVYNDFVRDPSSATVLFYVGNESPLEQYINNTGLMWELAEEIHAQIIFVEHRYEGLSKPSPSIENCMAYSSSIQALADYANFIERHLYLQDTPEESLTMKRRPVIAFGGSYGGMLAAWMRMKYPNLIAGAIAASAPIWAFPLNFPEKIESAYQVIQRGLTYPYPPTKKEVGAQQQNNCSKNLLAAWPLIKLLSSLKEGRELLTSSFSLCDPLEEDDADELIGWAQSPWFDLAEGSFPYPSNYITFALTHNAEAVLPAWPLQAACWNASDLYADYDIQFQGNVSDVRFDIFYGQSGLIRVDWDHVTSSQASIANFIESDSIASLLRSIRDAVSIWFNVTKDVPCYTLSAAPNESNGPNPTSRIQRLFPDFAKNQQARNTKESNSTELCLERMNEGSWPALNCNEPMNLIITEASGMGKDMFWPPSFPRDVKNYGDIIALIKNNSLDFCYDPDGIYGFPEELPDYRATWYDIVYGGTEIGSHSNIIFSNGLLDPWSAAGVYAFGMDPTPPFSVPLGPMTDKEIPGLSVQNLGKSMIALIMEYGGHHTDLMYSSDRDPPCIREGRRIEKQYIQTWVDEWWLKTSKEES